MTRPLAIIQHPPVLTRPPVEMVTQGHISQRSKNATTTTTITTTTTAEPPEQEENVPPRQRSRSQPRYNNYDYYYYNHAPTANGYDYYGHNGLGNIGGVSNEVEYEDNPTTTPRQRPRKIPRPIQPPSSTISATTTTPEVPELDDDIISSPAPGMSSSTYSGYCFCSPLSRCPVDSIPRGGDCDNFLAYFTNLRFIRCCYSPSIARSLQL